MYSVSTYLPSDLVCSEGWGRSLFVFDGLWESSGGAWTGICAKVSGNPSFLFSSPLFLSIIDRGNKGWTGQDDWVGWDDGVGQDNKGVAEMEGQAETLMGMAKMRIQGEMMMGLAKMRVQPKMLMGVAETRLWAKMVMGLAKMSVQVL